MAIETERRFVVDPAKAQLMRAAASRRQNIEQGYLFPDPSRQVRIRTLNSDAGFLTIKGPKTNGSGLEFEYPIPYREAAEMLDAIAGWRLRKTRYLIPDGAFLIELDIFDIGEGISLAIAEVEMDGIGQDLEVPEWFGPEITGNERFSNLALALQAPGQDEIDALFA